MHIFPMDGRLLEIVNEVFIIYLLFDKGMHIIFSSKNEKDYHDIMNFGRLGNNW